MLKRGGKLKKEEIDAVEDKAIIDRIESIYIKTKEKEWYTSRELDPIIGVSYNTIFGWVVKNGMPFKYMEKDHEKILKDPNARLVTKWVGDSNAIKKWFLENKKIVATIIARERKGC